MNIGLSHLINYSQSYILHDTFFGSKVRSLAAVARRKRRRPQRTAHLKQTNS
jgi:hypothetical protein